MLPFACGSPTTSDHIQSSLLFLFRPLSEIHTPAPIPTYTFIHTYSQWSTPRLSSTRLSLSSRVSLRTDPSSLLRRTSSLSVLRFLTTHHSRNSSLHIYISSTPTSSRLTKVTFPVLLPVCSTLSARPSTTPGRRFLV